MQRGRAVSAPTVIFGNEMEIITAAQVGHDRRSKLNVMVNDLQLKMIRMAVAVVILMECEGRSLGGRVTNTMIRSIAAGLELKLLRWFRF